MSQKPSKVVCIDGYNLAMPHGSGIATYGHTLLEALVADGARGQVLYGPSEAVHHSDDLNEATIISGQQKARKKSFGRAVSTRTSRFGVKAHPVSSRGNVHWPRAGMRQPAANDYWVSRELYHLANRAFTRHGTVTPVQFCPSDDVPAPQVMHWTCPLPLSAKGVPNILTVHDIIPLTLPHATGEAKHSYYKLIDAACHRADHILSVSETTRDDLIKFFPDLQNKISVTYQPILQPEAQPQEEVARWLKDTLDLDYAGYFLFYGAIEPKKNLGRIIEAYLESGSKTPLVIVAGRQWLEQYEVGLLDAHLANSPQSRIVRLDFLPRSSLDRVIAGAKATLFPSLYEGFGLPVLESMAQGVPVLGSNFGAIAEVAGDAMKAVDPYDVASIARGIRDLDHDSDLQDHLRSSGRERALFFNPEKYRVRLSSIYDHLGLL